jgi:superfamily II DNA helicase RecQ
MHNKADFRSCLQADVVVRSLKRMEFLYIAPCGLGKSLIVWLPMLCEQQSTVLFLPYALLRRNVHFQAETLGIESVLLELAKSVNYDKPPKLLVCAIEQISLITPILMQLARRNMLARIVIDEIQCVFTEEFRSVMKDYRTWRAQLAFGETSYFGTMMEL